MKRILASLLATVGGLAALLGFKSHDPSISLASGNSTLPSATLPADTASVTPATSAASGSASTSAPASASSSASKASSSSGTAKPTKHTYLGSAIQTRYGVVQVRVTVNSGKITDVSFAQLTAFDPRSQQINSYAGPTLLQETLSAQSAQISAVSGASYTSEGYVESLQSALDKAGLR